MCDLSSILFRLLRYCKHRLLAYNSKGEGIHSPYLFYLVRMVTCDENAYYVWHDIERRRALLLQDETHIHVKDFGTGNARPADRSVHEIASGSLERTEIAQLFFRWIVFISRNAERPMEIVELGTSLGITTAYLATANTANRVTTFEGCPAIGKIAEGTWQALDLHHIQLVKGNIDDTLAEHLPKQLDFAFVDANHTQEATLRYVEMLLTHIHEKTIIFIDDIHYSKEMEQAWNTLQCLPQVTTTMDFFHAGALFFDPHYLKKHYCLHLPAVHAGVPAR